MNQFLNLMSDYGIVISWFVQGVIGIFVIHLATKFAGKHIEEKVEELEDEVLVIKEQMKSTPTRDDIYALDRKIVELQGDIKRLDESIDGTDGLITRLELQVNRIEDFLKR